MRQKVDVGFCWEIPMERKRWEDLDFDGMIIWKRVFYCFLDRAFFNDEENNQQNALINSSINLLMSHHSDMFRLPS
jgi:hypothetical protein